MTCPSCGSQDHETLRDGPHAFRRPVLKHDRTWRVHRCKDCKKIFVSIQTALHPRDAQMWMDSFDAEEMASMQQTGGSSSGSEGTDGSSGNESQVS